jgi:hypothetical protein
MGITPNFKAKHTGLGGRDNLGGVQGEIFYAPKEWFTSIAPADAYPNDPSFTGTLAEINSTIKISTDHVFKPGFGFASFYATFDTSELKQGENKTIDKTGKMISLESFYPGDDEEALAFFSFIENFDCIVLVKAFDASPTAAYYQIGEANMWARIMSTFGTSKPTGDRKGTKINIEAFQARIKKYYGLVPLKS